MNRHNLIFPLILFLGACAANPPDRPDSLDDKPLESYALVVGSIAKPASHRGFDTYSIDMVAPAQKKAYRFRAETSFSPVNGGFPADAVINGNERSYFARRVEPGTYFISRHEVTITNTFTTYSFGQEGRFTRPFDLEAGDVAYVGAHVFEPQHDDEVFLWRNVVAPEYQIRNTFARDMQQMEILYPQFDWSRTRNLELQLHPENVEPIEDADVWINPFGLF